MACWKDSISIAGDEKSIEQMMMMTVTTATAGMFCCVAGPSRPVDFACLSSIVRVIPHS